jgi:hypothetical protein
MLGDGINPADHEAGGLTWKTAGDHISIFNRWTVLIPKAFSFRILSDSLRRRDRSFSADFGSLFIMMLFG